MLRLNGYIYFKIRFMRKLWKSHGNKNNAFALPSFLEKSVAKFLIEMAWTARTDCQTVPDGILCLHGLDHFATHS